MKKIFFLIFLLLIPQLVFAGAPSGWYGGSNPDGTPVTAGNYQPGSGPNINPITPTPIPQGPQPIFQGFSLTPPPEDVSVSFLSAVFGVVDGVLHGTGSQVLGEMFGAFNAAVLSVASIVIAYILIVSTINTAHEGELLRKKFGGVSLPIRIVVSIAALLPKASGYSLIQIFIMWLVVQGIGAADSIWAAALDYFQRGGILVQQNQTLGSMGGNDPNLVFVAGNILKSETCMYVLHNSLATSSQTGTQANVPDFTSTLVVTGMPSGLTPPCYVGDTRPGCSASGDTQGKISFPGAVSYAGNSYAGACGNVVWNFALKGNTPDQASASNYANLGGFDSRSIAVQQMVFDVEPTAYSIANQILPSNSSQSPAPFTQSDYPISALVGAGLDYMAIMQPYLRTQQQDISQTLQQTLVNSALQGWALAGSYYFTLSKLNQSFTVQENAMPQVTIIGQFDTNIWNSAGIAALGGLLGNPPSPAVTQPPCSTSTGTAIDQFICGEYNLAQTQTTAPPTPNIPTPNIPLVPGKVTEPWWMQKAVTGVAQGASQPFGSATPWAGYSGNVPAFSANLHGALGEFLNYLPNKFNSLMNEMSGLLHAQQTDTDPIVAISTMGMDIINAMEYIWFTGTILIFGISAGASIMMCAQPFGNALNDVLLVFVPLMTLVIGTMFVVGLFMAYYVPLIPFIIFIFTVIGWLAAVIEAMIAGPLVALGLLQPEGHEHFGAAQGALTLLLSVFIRPSLIIFGFIAGSILSHVGLWILNYGLGTAMTVGGMPVSSDITHVLSILAVMIIYVTLVLAIINRSFALIHEIPQHVLVWIGGHAREFGEARGAEGVTGQAEAKLGTLGSTVKGAMPGDKKAFMGAKEAGAALGGGIGGRISKFFKGSSGSEGGAS